MKDLTIGFYFLRTLDNKMDTIHHIGAKAIRFELLLKL